MFTNLLMNQKACLRCGEFFLLSVSNKKFCSRKCRTRKDPNGIKKLPIRPSYHDKTYWINLEFKGGYKLLDTENLPASWGPRSNLRVQLFSSNTGHIKNINFRSLYYENNNEKSHYPKYSKKYWLTKKFGKLILIDENLPDFFSIKHGGHNTVYKFKCDCGNITEKKWTNVSNKDTKSCGKCNHFIKVKNEWLGQKYNDLFVLTEEESEYNKKLNLPDEFSVGYGKNLLKIECKCICGKIKIMWAYDVFTYRTLSCGCALNRNKSNASRSLYFYIKSLHPSAIYSDKTTIKYRELDIWIPDLKLCFEYHGNHWHSMARRTKHNKLRDFEKYKLLEEKGIKCIQIYSDEWIHKRDIFEHLIKNSLNIKEEKIRIKTILEFVNYSEIEGFLNKHHYLSGNRHEGSYYIIAKHKDIIVGAWVFKKRDENVLEWTRAVWDSKFKSWNPHQKALDLILSQFSYKKIITFSDNRLFTGNMYKKLGFTLDKEIPPDYCYTNGVIRSHKFNFRVKARIDEELEAKKRNYYKLYDSGKKRWVKYITKAKNEKR